MVSEEWDETCGRLVTSFEALIKGSQDLRLSPTANLIFAMMAVCAGLHQLSAHGLYSLRFTLSFKDSSYLDTQSSWQTRGSSWKA